MDSAKFLERDVVESIKAGRKVEAIKKLRAHRNISLKEARALVDLYIQENPDSLPNIPPNGVNGGTFLLLALVMLAAALFAFTM